MFGLTRISGATASLMLNLQAVLTALLAWVVFNENADRRIVWGMIAIIASGMVLAWPLEAMQAHDWLGPIADDWLLSLTANPRHIICKRAQWRPD
jgi:drug/metabolite transporter (DMT)-like permease